MRIDPLAVALGFAICMIPVLFGLLVNYWPRPSTRSDNASLTDMVLGDVALRDEGDLLATEPPHDHCNCVACTFWHEWHRTMA